MDSPTKRTREDAETVEKAGVRLHRYVAGDLDEADLLHVEVDGHHETEFVHEDSAFLYYVVAGEGTFRLDGEVVPVEATDAVAAPPGTRIQYWGSMELVLVTAPSWTDAGERVVRDGPPPER